jgi:hypothetical protein
MASKKKRGAKKKSVAKGCRVYVINLKKSVWKERKFREANPDHESGKPMVYVGMTSHSIEKRFQQHLAGKRSVKYVERYGKSLRLSECREESLTRARAKKRERNRAQRLRSQGWAVWSK